jgi:hypothetical protein
VDYAELLAALGNAKADTPVMVRSRGAQYKITAVEVELDLGPHLKPEDIDTADLDEVLAGEPSHIAKALLEPRRQQQREVAECDGNCTEHRAMLSDKRTVWLSIEKA